MTFDHDLWPMTAWTYEGFLIISINQLWFKSDLNFSNEAIFTFSAYPATWPQMTFDLWYVTFDCITIWMFTYYINKPSLAQTGLQLFKWGHFHIFSLSYNLTSNDLWPWIWWPLTSSTNEGSHVASMTQLWFKSIKACGRYSQMLTLFHNNNINRRQSDPYVSFLLRQATQKGAKTCRLFFT